VGRAGYLGPLRGGRFLRLWRGLCCLWLSGLVGRARWSGMPRRRLRGLHMDCARAPVGRAGLCGGGHVEYPMRREGLGTGRVWEARMV
jgi:hypothetical protein